MPIVNDSLLDKRGIRILDTQLDDIAGQVGRYDLLYHTNGRIYIVFARTNLTNDGVAPDEKVDRQIWAAYSEDGGTTFDHLTQLTARNGAWYDNPAICQIEPDKTDSDIAVIFGAQSDWMNTQTSGYNDPYPYRFTMSTELVRTSPIDILTNNVAECRETSLIRGQNRWLWFTLTDTGDYLYVFENQIVETNAGDGFLDNAWQRRTLSDFGGTNDMISFKAHRLKNGHILLLYAGRTANSGGITQSNLFYKISADDGYTWTAPVALTNYSTSSLNVDLQGFLGVLSCDFAELSDGSLALVFQEGKSVQYLDYGSVPQFNTWDSRPPVLLESKNYLLIPQMNTTGGGVWVFDLSTGQFIFHMTTTTTPPVWSQYVYRIAVSPDEKYMAVCTDQSIDFFDISNANPANWVLIQSLRRSTTPALIKDIVNWAYWIDNTHCIFTYGHDNNHPGTLANCYGGKVDVTNIAAGIMPLYSSSERDTRYIYASDTEPYVDTVNGLLYCVSNYLLWATRLSDGAAIRGTTLANECATIVYDDINDEFLLTYYYGLYRYKIDGTSFTKVGQITTTSSPLMFPNTPYVGLCYPGSGIMFHLYKLPAWYDFRSQTCIGPLLSLNEGYYGLNHCNYRTCVPKLARNGEWALYAHERGQMYLPMKHIGRLRWGVFTYNETTKAINAASSNFYDLVNTDWVPLDDAMHLTIPRVCPAPSDNVVLAAFRYFPGRQGARPLAFVTGVMNREHQQLGMRAAIARRQQADGLALRGRMAGRKVGTLGIKVQIHMAKCVKMRAWIIPEQTQTIQIRAAIVGIKTRKWSGQFNVSHSGKTRRYRLQFTANTGYTGKQGFGMKTRIVTVTKKRFTGHFIVPANPTNEGVFAFSANMGHKHTMAMKAFLVSSR